MKIALISPKGSFLSRNPSFKKFWDKSRELFTYKDYWTGFSSGLLIVAALTPDYFKIEVIDENIESIDFNKDYDLVAISAMTQQANRAYKISDEFRNKGISVVMGGIHPTLMHKEAINHADTVIIGEAENTWKDFIQDFKKGKARQVYSKNKPADLRKSPIPRYELISKYDYKIIWVQTTRGCPHDCEFCAASVIFGSKYRNRKITHVIKEIGRVKNIWGNIHIGFSDDNMFVNKKFSYELLKELKNLNIRWVTQSDISIANDDKLLKLLKDSGCMFLFVGLESLDYDNLAGINARGWKSRQLRLYEDSIARIQSHGIGVMGAFIVGFDGDNKSVFDKIADFTIKNHLYGLQVTIMTPLPGTRLRNRLEKEGRLLSNEWDNYTFFDVNYVPKKITRDELQKGLLSVYSRVYNRDVHLEKARYFKEIYRALS
ncbi:MAG: B12-binding domain-containing radical SAM protein [Candidatus Omnitrophica bacterium CG_4_9_14_0_2_um_filter_42_8]|nr:MAG: B12-binding domain-containing radical SAM protein [Candidatus Omnitrophica bacterium CG22_combo_CG10-13_8_21_14_all_43_16]PJC48732.1 MAG: B12-binding domain-containing radical SAM protein [Candidatus Omnitrophica bacterium CG_4_9_14_0_2_um_filter_42_8]